MKKQITKVEEYIIGKAEAQTFLRALQYCRHRINEHNSNGVLSVGTLVYLQGIINELEEII
jgi:hypothetical protein